MKTASVVLSVLIFLTVALCAEAIERDARLVDWLGIEMNPGGDVDGVSVLLWGEQALSPDADMWSFLLGGQYGRMNPHFFNGIDFWSVGLGLRFYPLPYTSLDATAHYGRYDAAGSPDVRWAEIRGKQVLMPERLPVQPYVSGAVGVRYADELLHFDGDRVYYQDELSSEMFVSFGGGFEISLEENMQIVVDVDFTESDDLEDDATASIAMKYFWY